MVNDTAAWLALAHIAKERRKRGVREGFLFSDKA
jgi:hypothetical protein